MRQGARGDLVAHQVEQLRARADEGDARRIAGAGEPGILRKETVTGMDHVDALLACEGDDALDVEIGADGAFVRADEVGFIRLEAMDAEPVLLGVNGHGAQAQLVGGAHDADGDFAAVRDEQLPAGDVVVAGCGGTGAAHFWRVLYVSRARDGNWLRGKFFRQWPGGFAGLEYSRRLGHASAHNAMSLFHKSPENAGPVSFTDKEAVVALLFLVVTADGSIAPEEEELVIAASNRMKLLRNQSIDQFNDTVDRVREAIDRGGRDAVFAAGVRGLPPELGGTVYALAVDVAYAEGTACPPEVECLRKMQEALGISDDLATKVIEVMRIKNAG